MEAAFIKTVKPSFWILLVSVILCVAVTVFLVMDPFPYDQNLGMERSEISNVNMTSQMHVPVRIVSLSERDIDTFVDYCNSLKLRYERRHFEKGGWQYLFSVTENDGDVILISVLDDRHIKIGDNGYKSSGSLKELTEFVDGLCNASNEPEDEGPGYEACSFIAYRDGHYEVGVEIHTDNRRPIDLKLIDVQEFEGMAILVDDNPRMDELKYYCNSGAYTQHYQEWNTYDIKEEDLDKVIDIMRRHIFELTLADLEGRYPAIIDEKVLEVVVDIG